MTELPDHWSLDDSIRGCLLILARTGESAIAAARSTGEAMRIANRTGEALAAGFAADSAQASSMVSTPAPFPTRLRTSAQQWREEEGRETGALRPDYAQLASSLHATGIERNTLERLQQGFAQRQGPIAHGLEECAREEASIHDVIRQCESVAKTCRQLLAQMRTDLREIRP